MEIDSQNVPISVVVTFLFLPAAATIPERLRGQINRNSNNTWQASPGTAPCEAAMPEKDDMGGRGVHMPADVLEITRGSCSAAF